VVQAYFFWFARENISSPEGRQSLVSSGGFCLEHSQRFEHEIRAAHRELSASIVYTEIIEELISSIMVWLEDKKSTARFKKHFKHQILSGVCPACEVASQSEKAAILLLIKQFKYFEQAYKQSQGLCLKHLLQAFELAQDKKMVSRLAEVEKEILTELTDQERSAWSKVVSKLIGRRGSK